MSGETVLVVDDSPTILKVVQLVLSKAGFRVVVASDGESGLESARSEKPDLILLDFVMPKMNGYQVCRTLADDADLKDIPVVLMSAKGDQVGERFIKVMGIVDYITKPFSPEAITAVVQHSISKYGRRPAEDRTAPIVPGDLLAHAHPEADASGSGPIAPPAPDASAYPEDEPALTGDLRIVPLAEVLQLLEAQQQSGVLEVSRGRARIEVCFRGGSVDFASAQGVSEELLLGRFLVQSRLMTADKLEEFLATQRQEGRLIGAQLVKLGHISLLDLRHAIKRQTAELVYEVLRWKMGRFAFRATRDLPAPAVDAQLGLEVEGILMEGFRRVDEWHLIEREVGSFDEIFLRNEDAITRMGAHRLTREELAVLELVSGRNTVKDIIRQSRMGSFDVSQMIYRLLSIKLIRRRVMPVAV